MFRRRKQNKRTGEKSLLLLDDSVNAGMDRWKTPNKEEGQRRQFQHKNKSIITIEHINHDIESIPSGLTEQTTHTNEDTWCSGDSANDHLTPIQRHRSNQSSVRLDPVYSFTGSLSDASSQSFRNKAVRDDQNTKRSTSDILIKDSMSYTSHRMSRSFSNRKIKRSGSRGKQTPELSLVKTVSVSTHTKSLVDSMDETSDEDQKSNSSWQNDTKEIPSYGSLEHQTSYKLQVRRMEDDNTIISSTRKEESPKRLTNHQVSQKKQTLAASTQTSASSTTYKKPHSLMSFESRDDELKIGSKASVQEWTPLPTKALDDMHILPEDKNDTPEMNYSFCDAKSPLGVLKDVKSSLMNCISPAFSSRPSPQTRNDNSFLSEDDEFEYFRRKDHVNAVKDMMSPMKRNVNNILFRSMHESPMRDKSLLDDDTCTTYS